jgi:predicted AlkP superfamily pyrophosphatase or phosphodiesterase
MIDGLRPDALLTGAHPHLDQVRADGASTLNASSVMPSITLPCHATIFHSVPPSRHGITTNTWTPMARPLPGLVDVAKAAGLRSAFFHNWEPLRDLNVPGNLDFSYYRNNCYTDPDGDQVIVDEALRYIRSDHPDFAFVYMGTLDVAGHNDGWMSPGYMEQLARVDGALGALLGALPAAYDVVINSDHGGHERNHGADIPADMLIPWLAIGPNIQKGLTIESPVSLMDTAPTIARLLNIQAAPAWEGRCLDEIFVI